jgi:predicted small secreted protein
MARKLVNIILIAGAVAGLMACNMVRGVGEDLKSASNAVDQAT